MIVDGHIDIAWNALVEGRGFDGEPAEGYAVSRRALARSGVGLVFPTLYTMPAAGLRAYPGQHMYSGTPREAHLMALAQAGYYRSGGLPLIRTAKDLRDYVSSWKPGRLAGVLLMESAEPVETPAQVGFWAEQGVRLIGPAWMRTRYCGGTHQPGGLTDAGRRLLRAMMRHRVMLDLSHMADRSMRDSFELWRGPLVSTHSGARAINAGQRQVPDWALKEIGARDGIAGISFYAGHLRGEGPATVEDIVATARHFARVTGDVRHVALGSDMDGGFPAARAAIQRLEQLREVRRELARAFSRPAADAIMGGNWLRFLGENLP